MGVEGFCLDTSAEFSRHFTTYENKHSIDSALSHLCFLDLRFRQQRTQSVRRRTAAILGATPQRGKTRCLALLAAHSIRQLVSGRSGATRSAASTPVSELERFLPILEMKTQPPARARF